VDADATAQDVDLVEVLFVRTELILEETKVGPQVLSFLGGGGTA
jgi:hypothetical protein